jgi:hypothetical protein
MDPGIDPRLPDGSRDPSDREAGWRTRREPRIKLPERIPVIVTGIPLRLAGRPSEAAMLGTWVPEFHDIAVRIKSTSGPKRVLFYHGMIFLLLSWQPRILSLMREVANNWA